MEKNQWIERILQARKPYTPPLSREGSEECQSCVKCVEDAYLILSPEGPAFLDRAAGKAFRSGQEDAWPQSSDLDGWTAEIAFAQDTVLSCTFDGDKIRWEGTETAVRCRRVRERLYLLSAETAEGMLLIVLDTARFLVYGAIGGRRLGGYIRNMPQDR